MINLQQPFYSVRNEHLILSQSSSLDNASVHTAGLCSHSVTQMGSSHGDHSERTKRRFAKGSLAELVQQTPLRLGNFQSHTEIALASFECVSPRALPFRSGGCFAAAVPITSLCFALHQSGPRACEQGPFLRELDWKMPSQTIWNSLQEASCHHT